MNKYVITYQSPGGVLSELFLCADTKAQANDRGAWIYEGWKRISTVKR